MYFFCNVPKVCIYTNMKVIDLKYELKKRDLGTSGKKADLLKRLLDSIDSVDDTP